MTAAARSCAVVAALTWGSSALFAVDPPDLRVNPVSGLIEAVDATWSGNNYDVRYTVVSGAGRQASSRLVTSNVANDVDPRIALSPGGDACVSWWRDTTPSVVVYRKRAYVAGTWGVERTAGYSSESNSRPRLAYAGDKLWVVYQIQNAKSRGVGVQIIDDDPEPVRSIIATSYNMGELETELHSEGGHLWVTWIDTTQRVGYSEFVYNKGLWSVPGYESFSGDSASDAIARIRARVLGEQP